MLGRKSKGSANVCQPKRHDERNGEKPQGKYGITTGDGSVFKFISFNYHGKEVSLYRVFLSFLFILIGLPYNF